MPTIQREAFPSEDYWSICRSLSTLSSVFYTAWKVGRPYLTEETETAEVRFNKDHYCVDFLVNPNFWDSLNEDEKVWLIAHEILHVFLRHSERFRDVENKQLANIACDVSIHEYLFQYLGITKHQIPNLLDKGCFLENIFGTNAAPKQSAEYYYKLLEIEQQQSNKSKGSLEGASTLSDVSEGISEEDFNSITTLLSSNMTEQEAKEVNEILSEIEVNENKNSGGGRGTEKHYSVVQFSVEAFPKQPKWKTLIKKTTSRAVKEKSIDRWAPKNRRIQALSSNTEFFIPSSIDDEEEDPKGKPSLILFLDTSGSCHSESKRFYKAMKSIDLTAFNVRVFCFGDDVSEIDPKKDTLVQYGGTYFHILENQIQKLIATKSILRYPDLVFVLTDGAGNRVTPQIPANWHWFLTSHPYTGYIPAESQKHNLSDYEFYQDS